MKKIIITCYAFSIFAGIATMEAASAPVSWPGRVVDARTGEPISGIECYGGGRGRVDLTPLALSDTNGNYVVTYGDALNLDSWEYYRFEAWDTQGRYYSYIRSQTSPEPLLVRLVPKLAFIQGTVRDAVTGMPLADVQISIGRPGRYIETVSTGPDGSYSFNHSAYDGRYNLETIPEGEQAGITSDLTVPISDYWLVINQPGYRSMNTADRGLALTVQSSITDAIHTQVDLAIAPDGSAADIENATASLTTPQVELSVYSAHGSPSPAVGTTGFSSNSVFLCSVDSETIGSTNYSVAGWGGTGSVPASGTSNTVEITLTEDSAITWNWQTNYWLDVTVTGNGSVNAADGFYANDSEQILTATPDTGWLFMGWSGDASGTNEAFVMMDAPKTVMAVFSDDADGDGLLNSNETAIGSNPWKKDTDGDGFDDAFEFAKGLSLTTDDSDIATYIQNNDETFGLYSSNVVLDVAVGQMVLDVVGSEATLSLQLEESDDLVTWTNAGPPEVWNWTVDGEKKFFRVRSAK